MKSLIAILLFILILLLGFFGYRYFNNSLSKIPISSGNSLLTYKNNTYNVEFNYPKSFSFINSIDAGLKEPIVSLVANSSIPNTNLNEQIFTLSWESRPSGSDYCLKDDQGHDLTQTITVNGTKYYYFQTVGLAAGNRYTSKVYRSTRNLPGNCFEARLTVHTSNINNYPSQSGIKEVNEQSAFVPLESIFSTLKFN